MLISDAVFSNADTLVVLDTLIDPLLNRSKCYSW